MLQQEATTTGWRWSQRAHPRRKNWNAKLLGRNVLGLLPKARYSSKCYGLLQGHICHHGWKKGLRFLWLCISFEEESKFLRNLYDGGPHGWALSQAKVCVILIQARDT